MDEGRAALFAAIEGGDAKRVEELVAAEPSLSVARGPNGVSALMQARYRGDRAAVAALRSVDPVLDVFEAAALGEAGPLAGLLAVDRSLASAWSADGYTPLHFAAFFGGPVAARLLLDAGADPEAVSRNRMRVAPLHSAAAGQTEVVALLIDWGVDVNTSHQAGYTALHAAAQRGDPDLVRALLRAGADPAAVTSDGRTAQALATDGGHRDVAALIGDAPAVRDSRT